MPSLAGHLLHGDSGCAAVASRVQLIGRGHERARRWLQRNWHMPDRRREAYRFSHSIAIVAQNA